MKGIKDKSTGQFTKNIPTSRECVQCSVSFSPRMSVQRFCSIKCHKVSITKNHMRPCIVCDESFYAKSMKSKYCSHSCYGLTLEKGKATKKCAMCATMINLRYHSDRKLTCSKSCASARMSQARKGKPTYFSIMKLRGKDAPGYKDGRTMGDNAKEYSRIKCLERIARNKNAEGRFSVSEWESLKMKFGYMCLCCKRVEPEISLTIDHIVPLSKGGSNFIENIQPLCQSCNSKKNIQIINYYLEATNEVLK